MSITEKGIVGALFFLIELFFSVLENLKKVLK